MNTEEKIQHLRSLQTDLGGPPSTEEPVEYKSIKEEGKEAFYGVIVIALIVLYGWIAITTLLENMPFIAISSALGFYLAIWCLNKRIPLDRLIGGGPGISSAFNFMTIRWLAIGLLPIPSLIVLIAFKNGILYSICLWIPFLTIWHLTRKADQGRVDNA